MPPGSDRIVALRRLLAERHPTARPRAVRCVSTGIARLDDLLGGGLHTGGLTEFVSERASTGSQTCIGELLLATRLARQRIALVDAARAFDPTGLDDDALAHLVWVRCAGLAECWRAADLVARDPNFAVVVIDVRGLPVREVLRTRDAVWVRLQRAVEQVESVLLVQSDAAVVPNATCRVVFSAAIPPAALLAPRPAVAAGVAPVLQKIRTGRLEVSA